MKLPELKIGNKIARLPIQQGGMAIRLSTARLAAAVANEGGIGLIAASGMSHDELRYEMHLGLDFFDASIDRVSASVIGARSVKKALMIALLEPTDKLMEAEREGNFTCRLALLEEFKMLPAGIVFDEYCRRHDMPGADWAAKL